MFVDKRFVPHEIQNTIVNKLVKNGLDQLQRRLLFQCLFCEVQLQLNSNLCILNWCNLQLDFQQFPSTSLPCDALVNNFFDLLFALVSDHLRQFVYSLQLIGHRISYSVEDKFSSSLFSTGHKKTTLIQIQVATILEIAKNNLFRLLA